MGLESICKLSASPSTLFHSTVINFAASLGWFVCDECKWDQQVAKVCMKCKSEYVVYDKQLLCLLSVELALLYTVTQENLDPANDYNL